MNTTSELVQWSHEQKCRKTVESLIRNDFTAHFCATSQDAYDYILAQASTVNSIGFGGSLTITGLAVEAPLREQGKQVFNHALPGLTRDERLQVMRNQLTCDLFLAGVNALTISGEIVNIDATGNRVAAQFFGPRSVILVAGRNKLVEGTVQDAIKRIKDRATPPNAKRLNFKTPCAQTGFCANCNSPDRLCRVTVVMDRKPRFTDVQVLVVNEDLGL